ncbi:LOW QUALITY PROTEIN: hypothetical protein PHMEG_0005518 [Phytophthora megakarya]|uniref:Chromo domain-containing protein n=1 Tax=Phytophthora megakarya TaxID=4795 RepID=A0A225WSR5_9STRA|nr:LOW QUALITY PROTEIN: hypothetical protein PHMEG_0005518 [Phytophthora megakarya]
MILEYKIAHRDWVYLVSMVQSSLHHTAVPSLGNRSPVELFTGLPCPTPLREFYLPSTGEFNKVPACDKIDRFLDNLRSSIRSMHKVVEDQRLKQRMLNKKRERGENLVNFTEGDYVLRSRVDEKRSNKLLVPWVGPYRFVRADAHSYLVKHLITGAELDVHAARLKFYEDSSLEVSEERLEHISSQGIVLAIEKFNSHRWNETIRDFEVLWKGLEDIEDSYEPLASLAKDVPILVDQYVAVADQELKAHWQRATTTGETTWQGRMAVVETVKPTDKNRRKPRRRRSRTHPTTNAQVPGRSLPAVAAPQTAGFEFGTDNDQPDASTSRLVEVQANEGSVNGRTRSRTAGANRLVTITSNK